MEEQKEMLERIEKNAPVTVPYIVYRDAVSDGQWLSHKLTIALVVTIIVSLLLIFGSNLAWLLIWNQYDFSSEETITTVDSEGEGIANYTGGNGGVVYGEGYRPQESDNKD